MRTLHEGIDYKELLRRYTEACPRCTGKLVPDEASGEIVCGNCGLVVKERSDETGPERAGYTLEERELRSRTGAPMTLTKADKGLSTMIGRENTDAHGGRSNSAYADTLRKWDARTDPKNRQKGKYLREINKLFDALSAPSMVREEAGNILDSIEATRLTRGRSMEITCAAIAYAAYRHTGVARTIDEVIEVAVSGAAASKPRDGSEKGEVVRRRERKLRKQVSNCYSKMLQNVEMTMEVQNIEKYLQPVLSRLSISDAEKERVKRAALELHRMPQISGGAGVLVGKNPKSRAAGLIYYAGTLLVGVDNLTQKAVAVAAGVTEVTVRNIYKDIRDVADASRINSKLKVTA